VLVVFLASIGFVASPANAYYSQCQSGHVCFWKDINFGGQFIEWVQEANGTCWNVPGSWNDVVSSSAIQFYGQDVLLYEDANCATYFAIMRPPPGPNNAESWYKFFTGSNDKMTSFRFTQDCCGPVRNYPSPDPNARTLPEGGS
jgi:hypothetical protein